MALLVFPTLSGVTYPVVKGPQWDTDVQQSISGRRTTLGHMVYPSYNFELIYEFLRSDSVNKEWQTLISFFNQVGGRRDVWLFNDPDDRSVAAQGIGIGDAATTAFQLGRSLTGTSASWFDPVFGPTAIAIFDNGVLVDPSAYTVGTTGLITFLAAPAAGHVITWTGAFDWVVRFSDDSASFEQFMHNFWELKKIAFSSEIF